MKAFRVSRPRMAAASIMLMLAGCQSGTPPTPSAKQMTGLSSTSASSIRITFDGALATPGAEGFVVTDDAGQPLGVLAAYLSADRQSVDLATTPQRPAPYAVTLRGVRGASGTQVTGQGSFRGSTLGAPTVGSVTPLGASELLVTFTDPATGRGARLDPSAARPELYVLTPANPLAGAPTAVKVQAVRLSRDASAAVLTVPALTGGAYVLSAAAVRASTEASPEAPALIDPQRSAQTFAPMAAGPDKTRPTVKRVTALGPDSVQVLFSEPVRSAAADLARYEVQSSDGKGLAVTGVRLSEFQTSLVLTTALQADGVTYSLKTTGLEDAAGNALDEAGSALTFAGAARPGPSAADTTPPRVVSAGSTSNTTVLVSFSEAMRGGADGAENPSHYRIVGVTASGGVSGQGLSPQAATLEVTGAQLVQNGAAVALTTRPQSDIRYEVVVTGVTDAAGNPVAPPERGVDPSRATFAGTAPGGPVVDTDKDGLSDAEEMRGWTIQISTLNSGIQSREVTSDPTRADTDEDGLADRDEKTYQADPRDNDTDDDQLTDTDELNIHYTTPNDADSDNDALGDGLEVNFFRTSPLLDDTDGDLFKDGDEIVSGLRNPRIADIPVPEIAVGGVDLRLDVRFSAKTARGSRVLENKTSSTSLQSTESTRVEKADTRSMEWFAKLGAERSVDIKFGEGGIVGGKVSQKISVEGGTSGSNSSTFTRASVSESQRQYANSMSTDQEVTANEEVTREVVDAEMAVGLTVENTGNLTFTLKNLEVTALMPDPRDLGSFIPVATLRADGGGADGITIGPFSPSRGPFRFKATKVFPALVERLMQDPGGLIFRVVNYDITDEYNRNFAYTSQRINERTAHVVVDYGGLAPLERYRAATNSVFDASGRPAGRTLQSLMEDVLGLKHRDASEDAALSAAERQTSYSTKVVNGIEMLWRVRGLSKDTAPSEAGLDPARQRWFFIRDNTLDDGQSFGSVVVQPGQDLRLVFNQDLDNDGLTLSEEQLHGTSDKVADTDGDGLPDAEELYGPLPAGAEKRAPLTLLLEDNTLRKLRSNPVSADSDGDGLTDCQELHPERPQCAVTTTNPQSGDRLPYTQTLDPSDADTDGDGLPDGIELSGYTVKSFPDGAPVKVYSNPRRLDSDGDRLPDFVERRIGTNPGVADRDRVADDDGDGLANIIETTGWTVTTTNAAGQSTIRPVTSDPANPDSDNDGLDDGQERAKLTDPRNGDTDDDRLTDSRENEIKTNPLKADTDADGLDDFAEVNAAWTVRTDTKAPYQVKPNPLLADEDVDGLNDFDEASRLTDPKVQDTDGDSVVDGSEIRLKTNPLMTDKRVRLTMNRVLVTRQCEYNSSEDMGFRIGGEKFHFYVFQLKPLSSIEANNYYNVPDDKKTSETTVVRPQSLVLENVSGSSDKVTMPGGLTLNFEDIGKEAVVTFDVTGKNCGYKPEVTVEWLK